MPISISARIAFISGDGHHLGVMDAFGEHPKSILESAGDDTFNELAWTTDAAWLILGKLHLGAFALDVSIESVRPAGGASHKLVSNSSLRTMCVGLNGRVLFAQVAAHENDVELWEFLLDHRTGERSTPPRRIGTWTDWTSIHGLSGTRDGRHVTFIRGSYQADVHLGTVHENGAPIEADHRLTVDDRDDLPTAFVPNGKGVTFQSNRDGAWKTYYQDLDPAKPARLLTSGSDDYRGGRVTPDGKWLFYLQRPRNGHWSWQPPSLKAIPLEGGGRPVSLLEPYTTFINVRCARSPSDLCVLSERDPIDAMRGNVVFHALHPVTGRGPELARMFVGRNLQQPFWDVSPDGLQIGVVLDSRPGEWLIRILSLRGKAPRDVRVGGRTGLQSLDWAADGRRWYVSCRSGQGAQLLFIDGESGAVHSVRRQQGSFGTWAVPSPDGHRLAFLEWRSTGNVWMLEIPPPVKSPAAEDQLVLRSSVIAATPD